MSRPDRKPTTDSTRLPTMTFFRAANKAVRPPLASRFHKPLSGRLILLTHKGRRTRHEHLAPQMQGQPPTFPRMDDPKHARLRRMLTGDFTVKRMQAMRPQIEEIVNTCLDEMIAKGQPADLVRAYALPVPSLVICLPLGVPYADHKFFQRHTATLNHVEATPEEKRAANRALFDYLLDLILEDSGPCGEVPPPQAVRTRGSHLRSPRHRP